MIIWKWLYRTILALIILIMLVFFFSLTPVGFKSIGYMAVKFIPGHIHYQKLTGSLSGPIQIDNLSYTHNGELITVKSLHLDWTPSALLHNKLKIHNLILNDVTVISPANAVAKKVATAQKSMTQSIKDFFANLKPIELKPITLPFDIDVDHVRLTNVKLGHAENKINTIIKTVDVRGTIEPGNVDLLATVELLKPHPIYARLSVKGSLQKYAIDVSIKDKRYDFIAHGVGNKMGAIIKIPKRPVLGGFAQGVVALSWQPQIKWDIQLNLDKVDLQDFDQHIPRNVTLLLTTRGKLVAGDPIFDLNSTIKASGATVALVAHHHKVWNIKWAVQVPQIERLYALAKGTLKTQGILQGQLIKPTVSGTILGSNLNIEGISVRKLTGRWHLDFDASQHSTAHLALINLRYKDNNLGKVQLNLGGNLRKHNINATLNVGKQPLKLAMQAHYDGNNWNISLKSRQFSFGALGNKLMPGIKLTSKITMTAHASGTGSDIENASAKIALSAGMLTSHVDGKVINTTIRKSTVGFLINPSIGLKANVIFNIAAHDNIHVKMSMPQFTDYNLPFKDQKLHTTINILIHNFRFVSVFEHTLKLSPGWLSGQFTLNGTLGHPKIKGDAKLKLPHFEYTLVKVNAHNISAHVHMDGNKITYGLVGYAFNKAPLYFSGDTTLSSPYSVTHFYVRAKNAEAIKTPQLDVFVTTQLKFLLLHNRLDIVGTLHIPKATIAPVDFGSVTVMPINHVTYVGLPKHHTLETSRTKNLNLKLVLGKRVFFKAYGMHAQLKGHLALKITPQRGTIANGQLRIAKGSFIGYGQNLKFADGSSVSFNNSPITNPYINARAYKYVKTTRDSVGMQLANNVLLVGLQIHGTIQHMKFTLYSQPPGLEQADILSYFTLGVAAQNTNAAGLSVLFNAAHGMLRPNNGATHASEYDHVKRNLGKIGLNMRNETVLDVAGNPIEDQSSFIIGNQLTRNIYVQYSRGIIIPENIFTVQYRLNKNWMIQSQGGSGYNVGVGADVLYSIEH
ncbi:MAG: hypothetical protein COB66_04490 [Coxiella sp. (in: Bacteria)]|nr:MAG: hypothetical protein COB66_04490 [Coxiella sp. (in: g-proteobacteria)]